MPIVAPDRAETRQDGVPLGGGALDVLRARATRRGTGASNPHTRRSGENHLLAGIDSIRGGRRARGPWHRGPLDPPGTGGGARAGRAECDPRYSRRLRQVGRLPGGGAVGGARRRHRALHRADQGARRRSAEGGPRPRGARRPRHLLRRRRHDRGAGLGAVPRQLSADKPGHDPQRAAAEPPSLARLPPPSAGGDHRRVPRLPRRLRLARRPGAAQAPPRRGPPRRSRQPPGARLHPRLGHDRRPGRLRQAAHRPGRDRGDR